MFKEFKKFISRGNVLDMAVGVIIGGAFGDIVTSLVNDIITPIIGIILGKSDIDFSDLAFKGIHYGAFIQAILNFLIIAFCIFLMIKMFNKLSDFLKKEQEKLFKKEQKEEEAKQEEKVSEEILLLREINAELKKANKKVKESK